MSDDNVDSDRLKAFNVSRICMLVCRLITIRVLVIQEAFGYQLDTIKAN